MGKQRTKGEPVVQAPASPEVLRAAMSGRDVPCTHCGYNLRDCASDRCPECGCGLRVIVEAGESTRRRWMMPAVLFATATGELGRVGIQVYSLYFTARQMGMTLDQVASYVLSNYSWLVQIALSIVIVVTASTTGVSALASMARNDSSNAARVRFRGFAIMGLLAARLIVEVSLTLYRLLTI